jgi:hypothetical protein
MAWRFRKSFKILPGVRVNIGKRGISSASIGPHGFTTSVGKSGVFQNTSVPGTGLSYRQRLSGASSGSRSAMALGATAGVLLMAIVGLCIVASIVGRRSSPPAAQPARLLSNLPGLTATPAAPTAGALNTPQPRATELGKTGSRYTVGPRGGCYYLNSSGRKTYVDRGLCS